MHICVCTHVLQAKPPATVKQPAVKQPAAPRQPPNGRAVVNPQPKKQAAKSMKACDVIFLTIAGGARAEGRLPGITEHQLTV